MEFEIEERIERYTFWQQAWFVTRGFLAIFYIPIAYGKHIVNKLRGIKEPDLRPQNEWVKHKETDSMEVWSYAIGDEEEYKRLFEQLDFPDWKDWDDPFRFLLKLKTDPKIDQIEEQYFDEQYLETNYGIYVIRINPKGHGMTLCLLHSKDLKLIEVINLKPLSWYIKMLDDSAIELTGPSDKENNIIRIKIEGNKSQPVA